MEKIALTARYPYAGCSRIAKELELEYHYRNISMSQVLIEQYCRYMTSQGFDTRPEHITEHKEMYRRQLHAYALQNELTFIATLRVMIEFSTNQSIVIEKVRSNEQALALRYLGFSIIRIERPEHDVMSVARRHGHTTETWNALMKSGSEGHVSNEYIDDILTNSFSCGMISKYLVSADTKEVPGD